MQKVTQQILFKELLPKKKKITKPIELFVIAEMGKYLYEFYGMQLDITNLNIDTILTDSVYWEYLGFAVKNEWVVSDTITPCDNTNNVQDILFVNVLDEIQPFHRYYGTNSVVETRISKFGMYLWNWQLDANIENRYILHTNVKLSLVSICVKQYISSYFFGVPICFNYIVDSNLITNPKNIAYILELSKGMFSDFLFIDFKNLTLDQIAMTEYASWLQEKEDFNYTKSFYTTEEKKAELKRLDINIGDIVSIFSFNTKSKKPTDYFIGKVLSYDKYGITLDCIYTLVPKTALDYQYSKLSKEEIEFNSNINKDVLNSTIQSFDWLDIAVGYTYTSERSLILPLSASNDISILETPKGKLYIEQNDLIYWLLVEYNYDFDSNKFKKQYFGRKTPLYEHYKNNNKKQLNFF